MSMLPAAISCKCGFQKWVRCFSISVMCARFPFASLSPSRVASSSPPAPPPTTTIRCRPACSGSTDSSALACGGDAFSTAVCFKPVTWAIGGSGSTAPESRGRIAFLSARAHFHEGLPGDDNGVLHRAHGGEPDQPLLRYQFPHRDLCAHRVAGANRRFELQRLTKIDRS